MSDGERSPEGCGLVGNRLPEIWKQSLASLEEHPECGRLPDWFRHNLMAVTPTEFEAGRLVVPVASQLTREWLERRYRALLEGILGEHLGQTVELCLVPAAAEPPRRRAPAQRSVKAGARLPGDGDSAPASQRRAERSPEAVRARVSEILNTIPLNARFQFGSFVEGESNRFARAAASAVAMAPGEAYNPLFLHAGVGLGKTHLMQSIGQEVADRNPDAVVAYLSGEAFTSAFVSALREKRMEEFRRLYRHVDVWLVDDIQFIASKERTGEEFFHTFNALCDSNRQVVICSDRPPQELQILDERMISRFQAGLVADIAPPSYETRLAILQQKTQAEGAHLPADVLELMARMIGSNIRVLEGALIRLLAHASFTNTPINLQMASGLLARYFEGGARAPVRVELVQRVVCDSLDVPLEALTTRRRDRQSLLARQMAMYLSREMTDSSLEQIGQLFGGKDHSTIAHACRSFKQAASIDTDLQRRTDQVRDRIRRSK